MKKKESKVVAIKEILTPEIIIREAVAKGSNLAELKGVLELRKDYEANEARKSYHLAMSDFKANAPKIIKDKKVSYQAGSSNIHYNHASLANIVEKISSELSKHGLSASWVTKQNGGIQVTCKITHAKGHSEETTLSAPADDSGSKNKIQQIGSTITYLERYTLLALTGLATYDMDDDGGRPEIKFISEKQLSELCDIIDNKKINKPKFLAYMKIDKLESMPESDFQKAKSALDNILKAGKP
jgi:hypothetical protein